ncbi:hypothetical protein A2999_00280 [Candidatus Wolfebacteria bacterium RIFCSPLOWO2_01_FULL_38_11]|uniref:Uncharacterized protein n=1 Tax=Candidatus Wolfebacteria bacterium RIFCSPLOWO2_01_FULL_38_11 TaxID=1802556 RepID=A0A1F8DP43_9BACT|nr:MAG: hypothetical protein A2999_00280 [Candidatus Wolfebacteria bacterium RIFCSPLOWO2_01_FULL_38_11]
MNRLKIAAIVLVIVSGLAGSYFIVKNSTPSLLSEKKVLENSGESGISSQSPIEWVKNLVSGDYSQSIGDSNNAKNGSNKETANLTETVAQSLFGKMKIMDQSGNDPFGNFDINNSENQKLVNEALAGFNGSDDIFKISADDNNLKISNDNSREAKNRYLEEIKKISQKHFNTVQYQNFSKEIIDEIDKSCFGEDSLLINKLINIYQLIADDYLNIVVPSDWLDFHKKAVAHYKKNYLTYQFISNCSSDPIGGYLAVQSLQLLIDEAVEVQNLLNEKYKEI